jgi:hypothetical protein
MRCLDQERKNVEPKGTNVDCRVLIRGNSVGRRFVSGELNHPRHRRSKQTQERKGHPHVWCNRADFLPFLPSQDIQTTPVILKNITAAAEYNHCKRDRDRMRCLDQEIDNVEPKRTNVDCRVLIRGNSGWRKFGSGKFQYGQKPGNSGTFSPIMAVTRQIMAKGPKILAADRWRGKPRQLRRAGVWKVLVLRQFNLG